MARLARVVVPGVPHHVTQRGNRRQTVFFSDIDYKYYYDLLLECSRKAEVSIWSYCFMPNHVHLILVPSSEESLQKCLGEVHRRYTRYINFREGWRGYLWQGRFSSFPMSQEHIYNGIRYVELNPVRAGLVEQAADWSWSSAANHLTNKEDPLIVDLGDLEIVWDKYLREEELEVFRKHERTGRPLGNADFIVKLEKLCKRNLMKGKPGRKKNEN